MEEARQGIVDLYGEDNEEYVRTELYSSIPCPYISPELMAELNAEDAEERRRNRGRPSPHAQPDRKRSYQEFAQGGSGEPGEPSTIPPATQGPTKIGGIGAKIMMKTMNWKEGQGLGREGQGVVDIISTMEKNDTLGLGYQPAEEEGIFKKRLHTIDLDKFIPHKQEPTFFDSSPVQPYPVAFDWVKGLKVGHIGDARDYDLFCKKDLVETLFATKSKFDGMPWKNFVTARTAANPYEKIGKSIFQNRAAVKMANLDHLFNLTNPFHGGKLYFADICAGPGGFTEYIMWKKQEIGAQGFGFTLKGDCDWQLQKFNPESPWRTFRVSYGVDNTGNIFNNENIKEFQRFVDKYKQGGLDLVTADGGFDVTGEENLQEEKMRQLILCQILMMFNILGRGGDFMLKVFDLFTPFTVSLVYMLYYHFEKVSIISPYTSRPANSERYIVCKNLWEHRPQVMEYLFAVNERLCNPKSPTEEITTLMDFGLDFPGKQPFMEYLRHSNIKHLTTQVDALETIIKYVEDTSLVTVDQSDVEGRCLREWALPPTPRRGRPSGGPNQGGQRYQSHHGQSNQPNYSYSQPPSSGGGYRQHGQPQHHHHHQQHHQHRNYQSRSAPAPMTREEEEEALRNKHANRFNSSWTPKKKEATSPSGSRTSSGGKPTMDAGDLTSQYLRTKGTGPAPVQYQAGNRKRKYEDEAQQPQQQQQAQQPQQHHAQQTQQHHNVQQQEGAPSPKKRARVAPQPEKKKEEETFVLNATTLQALAKHKAANKGV